MTKRFYITHMDQYGERHQLSGAYEAETAEEAIKIVLSQTRAEDDGQWEAWEVQSESDIIE
ncbi:hypothetical protein V5F41_12210 [Xanthobacter autotrophicus]|uniref:hypothetical protein n=1 Tax=Xanthobacter autotrophicus TaxID=280 RepID=UPI003729C778